MTRIDYTQITFATPQARVAYSEAALENRAREVVRIYEGLRTDENDGEFALWSEDKLVFALHGLGDEIMELDRARAASTTGDGAPAVVSENQR